VKLLGRASFEGWAGNGAITESCSAWVCVAVPGRRNSDRIQLAKRNIAGIRLVLCVKDVPLTSDMKAGSKCQIRQPI
jgi:hypothetical protein